MYYSKTSVKRPLLKRPKIGFQNQLSLDAGQKYCRMLQGGHSAILKTFIKLSFVFKIFVLSIFEWWFYTGFTVLPDELFDIWRIGGGLANSVIPDQTSPQDLSDPGLHCYVKPSS